jgi:hypothetical protein
VTVAPFAKGPQRGAGTVLRIADQQHRPGGIERDLVQPGGQLTHGQELGAVGHAVGMFDRLPDVDQYHAPGLEFRTRRFQADGVALRMGGPWHSRPDGRDGQQPQRQTAACQRGLGRVEVFD